VLLATAGLLVPQAAYASSPTISGVPALGAVGAPYDYSFTLSGDPTPTCEAWTGQFPPGLTFDGAHCRVTGTPTAAGEYTVLVGAGNGSVDANGGPDISAENATFTVTGPPLGGSQDVTAIAGQPLSVQLPTSGWPAPTFSLPPGVGLPTWLFLDPTGLLHGTPPASYHQSGIPVRVANDSGDSAVLLNIDVTGEAPIITSAAPPAGLLNVPYSFRFTAIGAPAPQFAADQLPPGLSLDPETGLLSGTPTASGSYTVHVTASNAEGDYALDFTVPIVPRATALSIIGNPPSTAIEGSDYYGIYHLGGSPSPTPRVSAGQLPPGLTLDAYGEIQGRPTTPGTYTFTITAGNGGFSDEVSVTLTITVKAKVTIAGTLPHAVPGRPYSFAFTLTGDPAPKVSVYFGELPRGLTLSADGVLSGTPTGSGGTSDQIGFVADNGVQQAYWTGLFVTDDSPAPPLPGVRIGDSSVTEGRSGTKAMTFRITLSRRSSRPVTVHWQTANGTARAGSDYVGASGTVTFRPGQTVKTVVVRVKGDRVREPAETLHVRLSNAHGASIADDDGLGRILNDD
jgi:PKD repeat protein